MSHGATGTTQKMAFTNSNGRSFAGATNTANTADKNNNSTNGGLSTPFGSRGNAWGSSSIWSSSGGMSNSLAASTVTRENSVSRDVAQQPASSSSKQINIEKTGSGSLVDSSVCDEFASTSSWGANRNNSTRSIPQGRYADNTLSQQRGLSNAGLSQTKLNMNTSTMSFASQSRPPTVNLNSTAPAQARPSFGSAYQSGTASRGGSENQNAPFNVYTKFDRPSDPMLRKQDSPIGPWGDMSTTPSPSDERRPQFPIQYSNGRTPSMPASRDGSDPPSRHSDQRPVFRNPQYTQPSQRETSNSSRAPSISSQRDGSYSYFPSNADQMAMQFGQMNFGSDSRPSTSHRPSLADGYGIASASRGSLPLSSMSRHDSVEDIPRSSRNQSVHEEHSMSQQTNGGPPYSGSSYVERLMQSGGAYEFRPGQPYQGNSVASRSYDMSGGVRQAPEWSNYANGTMSTSRRSPGLSDQNSYLDPRIQQLMAAQLGAQYMTLHTGAYPGQPGAQAIQIPMTQMQGSPYLHMLPVNMNNMNMGMNMTMNMNMDPPPTNRDTPAGEGVQSALMYEFKANTKSKKYELRDIYDHIAEFSGDQHGSRFIQTKLETANSDEKDRVFREISPNAIQLMTDVFGNYVIQKFFEHGDQTHKKILANKMRGHVLQLSLQMYGCRVVQKALDHVLVDQQATLIEELENHVTKCVKDQNGNHVVQKAILLCPPATIEFIILAFRGQVQQLSIHSYGCRVIQRCLEKCIPSQKAIIMAELLDGIPTMISDQFGNYVVQHIVAHDDGEGRRQVMRIVGGNLEGYSKHKFASNVVEKCLERADDEWRRNVVFHLARAQQAPRRLDMRENEGVLVNMIKDNFGNYVIQKLLDTLVQEDYFTFLEVLSPAMSTAKRSGCGKQVLSIEKKMHRFENDFHTPCHNHGVAGPVVTYHRPQYGMPPMPMGMPVPQQQFVSNYNSAATTPPALTADTQSLQSSRVPSVNGDAIEGASASRKGSEQSQEFF